MPSRWMCRSAVTWASTPTTASRRSNSTVVAGLVRSAPARKPGGSRAASTLRPTASAVAGDTPVSITWFKCSVSVQNGSSPKVQCRKMYRPCAGSFASGPATRSPAGGGTARPLGATTLGRSLQARRNATSATKRIRPPDVTGIQWRSITYVRRFYNERLSSLTRTGRSAPSCGTNATRGEREGEGGATSRRVVDVLGAWGYEPSEPGGGIVLGNCPFDALAKACRPLVCKMNLALLRGVVQGVGARNLKAELRPQPGSCCVVFGRATRARG